MESMEEKTSSKNRGGGAGGDVGGGTGKKPSAEGVKNKLQVILPPGSESGAGDAGYHSNSSSNNSNSNHCGGGGDSLTDDDGDATEAEILAACAEANEQNENEEEDEEMGSAEEADALTAGLSSSRGAGARPKWFKRPLSAGAMTAPVRPPGADNPLLAALAVAGTPPGGPRGGRPRRARTLSTSASVSTEREPILRTSKRTIYTAGRPPWYDHKGELAGPAFVIGICGGSASGKTTVAQKIIKQLDVPWVTLLSMDSFYKVLNEKQHELAALNEYNFDHPDAFDFDLMVETLTKLKEGKKVEVPIYNFVTHRREHKTVSMYGANVLIFEGILAFHSKEVVDLLDMKVRKFICYFYSRLLP